MLRLANLPHLHHCLHAAIAALPPTPTLGNTWLSGIDYRFQEIASGVRDGPRIGHKRSLAGGRGDFRFKTRYEDE
jgi:hypothetical protein